MRAPRRESAAHPARHARALQQRMADLEQRIAELSALERRIVDQQDELTRLQQTLADQRATAAEGMQSSERSQPLQRDGGKRMASRRTLLKLGGAAAAASVAAVATNVAMKQNVAFASGVAWQTGTVNADTNTIVQPSSSGYSANNILQLQMGTGTIFAPSSLKAALAAYDTTSSNIGVYGSSSTGYGLFGRTDSGAGAHGAGLNGTANSTGTGVEGISQSGIGVQGNSANGIGGSFSGGQAPLLLAPAAVAGAPTSGTHVPGEVYVDANGAMWICTQGGVAGSSNPPIFYRLSSVNFLPTPIRLLDTRSGQPAGTNPGRPLGPQEIYNLPVAGVTVNGITIPPGATGVIGGMAVLAPASTGNLVVFPAGATAPTSASMTWGQAGIYLANFNMSGLGTNGEISIWNQSSGTTNMTFDAVGFVF